MASPAAGLVRLGVAERRDPAPPLWRSPSLARAPAQPRALSSSPFQLSQSEFSKPDLAFPSFHPWLQQSRSATDQTLPRLRLRKAPSARRRILSPLQHCPAWKDRQAHIARRPGPRRQEPAESPAESGNHARFTPSPHRLLSAAPIAPQQSVNNHLRRGRWRRTSRMTMLQIWST